MKELGDQKGRAKRQEGAQKRDTSVLKERRKRETSNRKGCTCVH